MEVLMSGSSTPVLAPVTRVLGGSRGSRKQKRRSDQRLEVTEADLNMYAMIVGRAPPTDAEKVAALALAKELAAQAEARAAEEAERPSGPPWSPVVLCNYLRAFCAGTMQLRVGGPQFSGWVRSLSIQARLRLQETQARFAGTRSRKAS
jgi:hypothetical protein